MHGWSIRTWKNRKQRQSRKTKKHPLYRIEIYKDSPGKTLSVGWMRRVSKKVLEGEAWEGEGVLSVILVDNPRMQELNRRFLRKNKPTDVLAFSLDDDVGDAWGEVYISEDQARLQSRLYGVSFREEVARLIIHGILHLMGYRDNDDPSRRRMTEKENDYLEQIFSDE